jgi:hypothetical protein
VTEATVNTIKYENVEVPNSQGANRVTLIAMDLDMDDYDAVTTAEHSVSAMIAVGKQVPTAILLNQAGAIHKCVRKGLSNGTAKIGEINVHDPRVVGRYEIGKSSDGKFYITVAVKGVNNTNPRSAYYHCDFEVERP